MTKGRDSNNGRSPGNIENENAEAESTVIDFPENATLQDQAASWLARLDTDQPSAATVAEYKQWIRQSDQHLQVFEQYMALWKDMNVLTAMESPAQQAKAARAAKIATAFKFATAFRWPALFRRLSWPKTALAGLLIAVIGLQLFTGPNSYRTDIGEQRTLQLADGTQVLLNTNTVLRVSYSDQQRTVQLVQGQAHFDVAHQPQRPFEVLAGQGKVRALGTAFSVYLKSDDVEVVVTEGIVDIRPSDKQSATPAKTDPVPAGNIVTYDRRTAEHMMQVALEQAEDKLAWHRGMLVFRNEPLASVIAEVNRYTDIEILIPDLSLRQIKVGGFFKVSDIDSVFDALEQGFDIRAKVVSKDVVYLVRQ